MSRALGDVVGNKEAGIIETPDVKTVQLKGKHVLFLVVGIRGLSAGAN